MVELWHLGEHMMQDLAHIDEAVVMLGLLWQVVIHMAFIVSAVALAWINKISHARPGASRHLMTTPGGAHGRRRMSGSSARSDRPLTALSHTPAP